MSWDHADDLNAICLCGHIALAHYDEHQPGCLGLHLCRCDPAPTTGCASCDCGAPALRYLDDGQGWRRGEG